MLAGVNPVVIEKLKEFPPTNNLDPTLLGEQNRTITAKHIEKNLDGLTGEQALNRSRFFIISYHDTLVPYLSRINATSSEAHFREVISLGDTIKFSLSPSNTKDHLSTNAPGVPVDDRNLIIKAFNLYKKKTETNNFFWIHLDKNVSTSAGLGGGSEIGSDIPFFFSNEAAYCTWRGEVVQDLPHALPTDLPMVLIKPQEACPTAEVYKRLHLGKTSSVNPLTLLEKCFQSGISQDVCINNLESPAFDVLLSLKRLKQCVLAAGHGQYSAVFMSGSGSSIVGIDSPDPPQLIYDKDEYNDIFISEASFLTVCDDLLALSIAEMNINDVEVWQSYWMWY
ncbi:hypothetical protein IEQ34_009538 [Dendrobium chrysotoxum]|uniref:Lipoxygenase domain-containing protein n=1 Tax=Dendrobium chrysotoxum TaxID=161865 RepID=A0AAV7H352_DENCH|nr:hypothetical protein IEQ34_009538 [Dendrobium chrysotoxum]